MPETRTRTLGQIIAVERGLKQDDNRVGSDIRNALKKESLVTGQVKTYTPFAEEMNGDRAPYQHVPDQYIAVQHKVEDDLDTAMKSAVLAMNAVASKDRTNCDALADILLEGEVFVPDVPISHLLWLKNYLGEWRAFLSEIPTYKLDKQWTYDEDDEVWKSDEEKVHRTIKDVVPVVLYPATDKHPAQVQAVSKDVPIGTTTTVYLSGAVSPARKRELTENVNKVLFAVRDAIAVANRTVAVEVQEGEKILNFILGR